MKKTIFVSALLVLLPLSVVQADLEFNPFPFKTVDSILESDDFLVTDSTPREITIDLSEGALGALDEGLILENGHTMLQYSGISSGG